MTWHFQGNIVDILPEDCIGFVYIITNNITGKKYIGKKLAKFSKTTQRTVKLKNGTKKKISVIAFKVDLLRISRFLSLYKIGAKLWFSIKNKNNFKDFILSSKNCSKKRYKIYI